MTVCLTLSPADRAVDELIRALVRRGFVVIAPTVRDGAIVLDEVRDVSALPIDAPSFPVYNQRADLMKSSSGVSQPELIQRLE